jgi:hypothetical protein
LDLIDAATLFRLLRAAPGGGVEHQTVTALDRVEIFNVHPIGQHPYHGTDLHPAMAWSPPVHDLLMIRTSQEVGTETA